MRRSSLYVSQRPRVSFPALACCPPPLHGVHTAFTEKSLQADFWLLCHFLHALLTPSDFHSHAKILEVSQTSHALWHTSTLLRLSLPFSYIYLLREGLSYRLSSDKTSCSIQLRFASPDSQCQSMPAYRDSQVGVQRRRKLYSGQTAPQCNSTPVRQRWGQAST